MYWFEILLKFINVLHVFSSKCFILSGLIFNSLIHFEFFLLCVKECSVFILLHVSIQFFQHHLLKRLLFLCGIFLPPLDGHRHISLSLDCLSCSFDLYFCFYASTYRFDHCSFVVQSEAGESDSSSSIFLSQDYFCCLESFVFPYKM